MPTYEYRCDACGHRFEKVLSITEHDTYKPRCPACKSRKVKPAYSTVFVKTSRKS